MSGPIAAIAGTFDTKAAELTYIADCLTADGTQVRLIDLSTGQATSAQSALGADQFVPASEVAAHHPDGAQAVLNQSDRGAAVTAMAAAFTAYVTQADWISGMIGAGGSGGTALIAPAMRALPIGLPKLLVSTVASGNVAPYVGPCDITMMYSVTDVQGLNRISRRVLGNAAHALAGMMQNATPDTTQDKPAIGLTMFGVTTHCVSQIAEALSPSYDPLVFHATGTGGQSMEKLVDSGLINAVIDLTTTEIADMLVGGVFPATPDRMGAIIRTGVPYIGSLGALDMVNFGARETVPDKFKDRQFHIHNPQVTLMRTTATENAQFGAWIAERLNAMTGPTRFLIPSGGLSALDAPDQAFHDPQAAAALILALQNGIKDPTRLVHIPHNINSTEFAQATLEVFHDLITGAPQ